MDIVYRRGAASAEQVREDLPDPLTNSAVRGMLRLLEEKGFLRHEQDGPRYLYMPTADPDNVRRGALDEVVRTFFSNSAGSAVAALLGQYGDRLSDEELDRLEALIERARGD
jgi:predicted transcriptional regulator